MALTTVTVQGADGVSHDVVMDLVSSDNYPVYKLTFGAIGEAGTLVSSDAPLPVVLSDGTDQLGVLGDGDTVDPQDDDGTVGTTKGILAFGLDAAGKARLPMVSGQGESLVQLSEDTGQAILTQLKIANFHLSQMTQNAITKDDVE